MSTVSGLQRSRLDVARYGIHLLHREMMKLNFFWSVNRRQQHDGSVTPTKRRTRAYLSNYS